MDRTNLSVAAIAGLVLRLKLWLCLICINIYLECSQILNWKRTIMYGPYSQILMFSTKFFQYNIIALVFFPTYIFFQIPSTVVVREVGPRLHLGTITLLWVRPILQRFFRQSCSCFQGCCMIGMGFVKTWGSMAGLRVVLGMLEAGFFPSCVYLLSTWYTRYEVHKRCWGQWPQPSAVF